jgi:hypothetical protein
VTPERFWRLSCFSPYCQGLSGATPLAETPPGLAQGFARPS